MARIPSPWGRRPSPELRPRRGRAPRHRGRRRYRVRRPEKHLELALFHRGIAIEIETDHRGVDPDRRDFDAWFAYAGETAARRRGTRREDILWGGDPLRGAAGRVCSPVLLQGRGQAAGVDDAAAAVEQLLDPGIVHRRLLPAVSW